MVGGLFPVSRPAQNRAAFKGRDEVLCHPDMVEPAAAVRGRPVPVAIRPPRVELLFGRDEMAHGVVPALRRPCLKPCHFHRRMANDIEQLLMAPDVLLQRRDIEVAHENSSPGRVFGEMCRRLGQKIELMGEFLIRGAVGDIAAGGYIEIMDGQRAVPGGKRGGNVPAIGFAAPIWRVFGQGERQAREDGHAVIPFHAALEHMGKTDRPGDGRGEQLIRHFGFLQADYVRRQGGNQRMQMRLAQTERIDIPGGDGKRHRLFLP